MKTLTLDLCPGNLRAPDGSPFEIPVSGWKDINDYLVSVAGANLSTTAGIESAVPAYADLKRVAGRWQPVTLPGIIRLAQGIDDYGSNTVAGELAELHELVSAMQGGVAPGVQAAFQRLMGQILATTRQNTAAAAVVVQDLADLDTDIDVIEKEVENLIAGSMSLPDAGGGPPAMDAIAGFAQRMSQLASILSAVGTPPGTDVARIRGAWAAISDDLTEFQSSVNEAMSTGEPFVIDLNLDIAASEWADLAAEARRFAQNARRF